MMRLSALFALLLAFLAAVSTNAFAPAPAPAFCKTAGSSTELAVKVKVSVGDGEQIESVLRRFKREVSKSGHMIELRHRRYFENSQDLKKRKILEARRRKKFERLAKRRAATNRT